MKNRKLFTLLLLLTGLGSTAMADNVITTNEVVIRPGGTTELIVNLENDADFKVYAYDFRLYLPDGIEVAKKDNGKYIYELAARNADHSSDVQMTTDGAVQFGVNSSSLYLTGTEGPVLGIKLKAADDLELGTVLQGRIEKITYANYDATVHPANMTFDIKVQDLVVLDENATMLPDATDSNVDILVKRTIKGGEWSTICLPFAMSADKLKAAFGNDYQLAYISGTNVTKEGGKVTAIDVKFTNRTAAAVANTPYIIKVSQDITEFNVNAKINPVDAKKYDVTVEDDESGEEVSVCSMTGNLKAGTVVPDKSLFLTGNQFWYSSGKTKMKAFRAYFTFNDVLADVAASGARIGLAFGSDETTGIGMNGDVDAPTAIYDMLGRKVEKPSRKGLYIKNGEKVVIK